MIVKIGYIPFLCFLKASPRYRVDYMTKKNYLPSMQSSETKTITYQTFAFRVQNETDTGKVSPVLYSSNLIS